ncbi:MAG: flagellar export protein FliJ [Humidesulfovibrio sp.]|nr:flagellar export protein FliJ [Humidesulfovibrio sp.]
MSKPFVFRLEKVLEYRCQLENQARMALAHAQARHKAQEEVVKDVETRLADHVDRGFGAKASQADIWLWMQYRQALERDFSAAKGELQRLASILQHCRQEAVLRSREKKLLEKLKDRQAKKHHVAENLAEQKEFDEMATLRHEPKDS